MILTNFGWETIMPRVVGVLAIRETVALMPRPEYWLFRAGNPVIRRPEYSKVNSLPDSNLRPRSPDKPEAAARPVTIKGIISILKL